MSNQCVPMYLSHVVPCPPCIGDNSAMSKNKDAKNTSGGAAKTNAPKTIALNRTARHDYHLEDRYEAGIALQGWELKSIRAGRMNMGDAYAVVRKGEIYLFGAQITPLLQASTHVIADDRRTRKLLLHRNEIDKLIGKVERDGYTLIPTAVYWKANKVKLELALAKGKQDHDKRQASKDRDWQRDKQQAMRAKNKYA
jgi:SsrA-binding protein